MKSFIKCGFGITLGVMLAKGLWGATAELYFTAVSKSSKVNEHLKKYFPDTYEKTAKYRQR